MNSNQEAHSDVMKFGGLQYHPSDCQCQECRGVSIDPFDEWLESNSEDNFEESEDDIIETAVVSEERIRENEMLRCILEPYLNDVECIGWGNLSDTELFDILIESILNHNSFLQCDYYQRLEY